MLQESLFVSFEGRTLILRKMWKEKIYCKIKALISCIPIRSRCFYSPITKGIEITLESKFTLFDRWTLILRKMDVRKAFIAKLKNIYHASQWGECDCSAESQKELRL